MGEFSGEFSGLLTVLYADSVPVDSAFHSDSSDTVWLQDSRINYEAEPYHLADTCKEWTKQYGVEYKHETRCVTISLDDFKNLPEAR